MARLWFCTQRYKAHDEENKCHVGDRVRIQETRPLSRTKRWVVTFLVVALLARPKETTIVIQPQSYLNVADNSGARKM